MPLTHKRVTPFMQPPNFLNFSPPLIPLHHIHPHPRAKMVLVSLLILRVVLYFTNPMEYYLTKNSNTIRTKTFTRLLSVNED